MSENNEFILKTFIPGTKAKASEVNSNFSVLKDAINFKADMNGNELQPFSVANAEEDFQAMNKGQVKEIQEEMNAKIQKISSYFCAKSGNVTNGNADLFTYSGLTITSKVGGIYPNLVCLDYEGNQYTFDSFDDLSMVGKENGVYNIFVDTEGNLYVKKNIIYIQKTVPQMLEDDIWLDTSVEPVVCKKYVNEEYVDFHDIPLGKVYITNGAISKILTFSYNQNGYTLNSNSFINFYYDYTSVVGFAVNTTHTMTANGLLYVFSYDSNTTSVVSLDGYNFDVNFAYNTSTKGGYFVPVNRGQKVYVFASYSANVIFVPLKFRKENLCI
ncbi:MAG: hypothetical protein MJ229_02830 [bacterium]|nr:hypothetical protein [bacterium]